MAGASIRRWCLLCLYSKLGLSGRCIGPSEAIPPFSFVGQGQGLTAFQSTKPLCLLGSMAFLEYVSFKLRIDVAASLEAVLLCF